MKALRVTVTDCVQGCGWWWVNANKGRGWSSNDLLIPDSLLQSAAKIMKSSQSLSFSIRLLLHIQVLSNLGAIVHNNRGSFRHGGSLCSTHSGFDIILVHKKCWSLSASLFVSRDKFGRKKRYWTSPLQVQCSSWVIEGFWFYLGAEDHLTPFVVLKVVTRSWWDVSIVVGGDWNRFMLPQQNPRLRSHNWIFSKERLWWINYLSGWAFWDWVTK